LLAMDVNGDAGVLNKRSALALIASKIAPATESVAFGLLLQVHLQLGIDLQLGRQLIQVTAFRVLLVIHQHDTDQVNLGR
jgi:hypothetical protein